ncbi:MAG TPA: hypothetical protein VHT73_09275 [Thermodesulfobacteriota bacterium]|nr:hypothetical protein [Thermodesulfobacteriota bacterium]
MIKKFHFIIGISAIIFLILIGYILINYFGLDSDSLTVNFNLSNIKCYDEADNDGGAEPYLWTVFFKIDGDTVIVNDDFNLEGTASVFGTPGNHGNLGDTDVKENDTVPIPDSIGKFETTLKPIPVKPIPGLTVGGAVGVIAILMEEDSTPEDAVAEGHSQLNTTLQNALNSLIPKLSWDKQDITKEEVKKIESKITSAIRSAIANEVDFWDVAWGFITLNNNHDDRIGTAKFILSYKELEGLSGRSIPLRQSLNGDHGSWEISGSITAVKK